MASQIADAAKAVARFVTTKHTSLTAFIAVVLTALQLLHYVRLDVTQYAAVMAIPPALWLLIGSQTNTANVRLTGKMWGGPDGVTASDVAANVANNVVELSAPSTAPDPVQAAGGPASRGA